MREFPGWRPPLVDWPAVVELGQTQVRQVVADLSAGATFHEAITRVKFRETIRLNTTHELR